MPIHFTTLAANADRLNDDDRSDRQPRPAPARPERKSTSGPDEVKPGKDINAPGFLKEKETPEPTR
ncbi:MAG: hypothetical protein V4684_15725 [Pseudomonadota bacterium]